jgi:hypothetical protein
MVIGGGAAGLNGALIVARSRRSVIVIDSGSPRSAPAEAVHGLIALDGTPPAELLQRGRAQVRQHGGRAVHGEVVSAEPGAPSADGDLRFTVTLADGRGITARRILVARAHLRHADPQAQPTGRLIPRYAWRLRRGTCPQPKTPEPASASLVRPLVERAEHTESEHVTFDLPPGTYHAQQGGDPDGRLSRRGHGPDLGPWFRQAQTAEKHR